MIKIQGLENYNLEDIQTIVLSHFGYLQERLHLVSLEFSIIKILPIGSRVSGLAKKESDFDIKIIYTGSAREDDMFNALNDKTGRLVIENIIVDFYPEKLNSLFTN